MFGHFASTLTGGDWLKLVFVIGAALLLLKGLNTPGRGQGGGNKGGGSSSSSSTSTQSNNNTTNTPS